MQATTNNTSFSTFTNVGCNTRLGAALTDMSRHQGSILIMSPGLYVV